MSLTYRPEVVALLRQHATPVMHDKSLLAAAVVDAAEACGGPLGARAATLHGTVLALMDGRHPVHTILARRAHVRMWW